MIARRNAERAAEKARRGEEYLKTDEIDAWREQGVALGLLDPDYHETTRPTDATAHRDDHVVPAAVQTVHHIIGDHPEPALSAGTLHLVNMWEHPQSHAVKVV